MASFLREKDGFRYVFEGTKTNSSADSMPPTKYPAAQNIRAYADTSVRTRPGMTQLFSTDGAPQTDIRAYSTLGTDNKPRLVSRGSNDKIWLDSAMQIGTLMGSGSPGAIMIPFRPNQSPNSYLYIANGTDYQKFSAPDNSGHVSQQNVGIAEPLVAPDAGISANNVAFMSAPGPATYTVGGTASGLGIGARVTDTVQGEFPDPTGSGMVTIQVAGGANLATRLYLQGSVLTYFWPRLSFEQGQFARYYPLSTATASATSTGNSLLFNPPQFNGTTDPFILLEWATIDANGNITSYHQPWSGATQFYDMVVVATLFVPAPGTYTIKINHDDGMIFAISGATLVSGGHSDPQFHVQTAVNGYAFANGGIGGNNNSGNHNEVFQVSFPASGSYGLEIDFMQWEHEQQLVITMGDGTNIFAASGISAYQRGMAIVLNSQVFRVDDVFPPLPQSVPIANLLYFQGTTGKCVVVPATLGSGPGIDEASVYEQNFLASIRRGALVQIGSEVCYVWDVETGPDGTICFTTFTNNAHGLNETIRGVPAIAGLFPTVAVGTPITSPDVTVTVATGLGTVTSSLPVNPFTLAKSQPQDLLHISINVDNLASLNEVKLLFDVGIGDFAQNFYYYTIRPNDIAAGVQNTLTQLGVAQLVAQRAAIDEEKTAESSNQGPTSSSAQSATGASQWSEITFPITALTRVGNDQSKSLQNVNAVRVLVNASGAVNFAFNSIMVSGGYSPDVGQSGAPYLYRVRPRSSVTGAKGNPSPATRYGVNPRRERVTVYLPSPNYDAQIDTWDVYRYGGTVTSWRLIGSQPSSNATFLDNYGDETALAGESLDFDNYQPWPSVDVPFNGLATSVCGTLAIVTATPPTNILRFLPGNQVRLGGQNVYTLYTRPLSLGSNAYLMQFVENAGSPGIVSASIYEPAIAQQRLPYMWGPDADGTLFACGDPLRLGTVYECKSNDPDAAPDTYNQEITPPSEPLLGGETIDGVPYVASTERWWRLYFQGDNPLERYSALQQPFTRGLAAPYAHSNDGAHIFFWAKDGIYVNDKSLTDADLYNLFPHEGVAGMQVIYGPVTYFPPDYSRAGTFRLSHTNGYLYASYQDTSGVYRMLVCDLRRGAWMQDQYAVSVTVAYHPEQQEGTLQTNTQLYPALVFGTTSGVVAKQQDFTNDLGSPISAAIASFEFDGGDVRAGEQWGDIWVDLEPITPVTLTPMFMRAQAAPPTIVPAQATRVQTPVSVGGSLITDFLGLLAQWTDNFSTQSQPTLLRIWQPSFLIKPETTQDRFTDWYSMKDGDEAAPATWWQGFVLHADTGNAIKSIVVRDADTGQIHPFTPAVQHNGEQSKAYSFNTPFIAHLVRIEPTDQVPWRIFDLEWIGEPTPEAAETWQTQGTSFGFNGYSHIQRLTGAYAATSPVTLTITSFDGQSPAPITLPPTGGAYQKILQVLTANKGQLFFFKAASSQPFQLYLDDFEIIVGNWGRDGAYVNYKSLGGERGDKATV